MHTHLLTSWKEISAYLGKGVRTVQRWERQLGLPIRRPDISSHNIVFALPEELDAWVISGSLRRPEGVIEDHAAAAIRLKQLELENAMLKQKLLERAQQSAIGESPNGLRKRYASDLE